jgi:hypothetical protein
MCKLDNNIISNSSSLQCDQTYHLQDAIIVDAYYDEQDKVLMIVSNSLDPINIG